MRRRQLAGLILASALITLDGTATTIALPAIGRGLSALLLPAGTLADRYGRVVIIWIGLIAFVAGSCAAAAAQSEFGIIGAFWAPWRIS